MARDRPDSLRALIALVFAWRRLPAGCRYLGWLALGISCATLCLVTVVTGDSQGFTFFEIPTPVPTPAPTPEMGTPAPTTPAWPIVFRSQPHGQTYRIPALLWLPPASPFPATGRLLAFAERRQDSREDNGKIDIVVSISDDEGASFSEEMSLFSAEDFGLNESEVLTIGNPTVVLDEPARKVLLLFIVQFGYDTEARIWARMSRGGRWVFLSESMDDGLTWSTPRNLSSSVKHPLWTWYATGPGAGVQIKAGPLAGRLVVPCDHVKTTEEGGVVMRSHLIYSDNGGEDWHIGAVASPFTNECAVAELRSGALLLNSRDHSGMNQRVLRTSLDGGVSWATAPRFQPELIEPSKYGCQASMISTALAGSGASSSIEPPELLFFSNPASSHRANLTVRLSVTQGRSWNTSLLLYGGPSAYSSLAAMVPHQQLQQQQLQQQQPTVDPSMKGGAQGRTLAAAAPRIACLFENGKRQPYDRISLAILDPSLDAALNLPVDTPNTAESL